MTNREAIKLLKEEIPPWIKWNGDGDSQMVVKLTEAFNLSIQALEKQEPKKVLIKGSTHNGVIGKCPACDKSIYQFSSPYNCIHKDCGQAIDWSKD